MTLLLGFTMLKLSVFSKVEESVIVTEAKRIMSELAGSYALDLDATRAKVLEVAPGLSTEVLHELTNQLVRARIAEISEIKELFSEKSLARAFLAYEFVNQQEQAVKHISGAIRSGLTTIQWLALQSGGISVPKETELPEVAYFMFLKENFQFTSEFQAATLTPNRNENDSEQIKYLNEIDGFIVKYFVAHIVEMYLGQKDRKVYDESTGEFLGYRAGFKVKVALDVRKAIVDGKIADLQSIFSQSLVSNHLDTKKFMDGKTREYISSQFEETLTGVAPVAKNNGWKLPGF